MLYQISISLPNNVLDHAYVTGFNRCTKVTGHCLCMTLPWILLSVSISHAYRATDTDFSQ